MALYEIVDSPVTFGDDKEFTVHLSEGALVDLTDEQAAELGDAVRRVRTDDAPAEERGGQLGDGRPAEIVPVEHSTPAGPAAGEERSAEAAPVEHSTPAGGVEVSPAPAEVTPDAGASRAAARRPKGNASQD